MKFNTYQEQVVAMPLYDDPILGLMGEVGEVVELIKKDRRPDNSGRRKPLVQERLKDELSDVLWYLTRLASENNINLDDIATHNIEKLTKRHKL